MRKYGYTLVELIIVVAIICILMSITFYGIKFSRNGARKARAKSDMISLGHSVMSYYDINKDNSELNNQWPRNMYSVGHAFNNILPWELTEKAYWSKSEPLNSNIVFERFPCFPNYGEYYKGDTMEGSATNAAGFSQIDFSSQEMVSPTVPKDNNRLNACSLSDDVAYVGIDWAGLDGDFGISDPEKYKDNGFLLLYAQKPVPDFDPAADGLPNGKVQSGDDFNYVGNFILKMGGSDEKCEPNCTF